MSVRGSDGYEAYVRTLRDEFPGFKLVDKRTLISQRLIDRFLRVLSFGTNASYLTSVVTTFGDSVLVPANWSQWTEEDRLIILRHEAVHMRQYRRLTWPGMALVYLALPVPFFFAAGRAWLELEAYKETLTATWEIHGRLAAADPSLHERIVRRFTGSDYAWMWVFGGMIQRALRRHVLTLEETPIK